MSGSPSVPARPDFILIGAMKAATSSLHDQLASQDGIVMSDPKEPCFFSDDDVFAQGADWYASLFSAAGPSDLCGESSTHYTKLPRHPDTIDRIASHPCEPRFIYMLRHPIDRLVSHYIHDWSFNVVPDTIAEAVIDNPDLIDFGRYGYQIRPYVERFGAERIHIVLFEDFRASPQVVLEGISTFLGREGAFVWHDLDAANVSSQRMRSSPWRDRLLDNPVAAAVRRRIVPKAVRERVAARWQMRERPELSDSLRDELTQRFDKDLTTFADLFGIELSCAAFGETAAADEGQRA